ncbi:M48 family metallopeptidase [Paracoccus sp. Z118]|uniref:M48 family metallopeptidase n=1 Tax=Paracoccus sp. Z118 TaxID=2851017 RepID=UPI001C2BAAF7|nr:M48 family metallopeptidase [Paracoccus sp. Z118]MBV0890473.1 M48 family metallopeptidase [Paracoccus sp. Z118]
MIKFLPILLMILYAVAVWMFSVWRLKRELDANSTPLADPRMAAMLERLGAAMGLPPIRAHIYEVAPVNGMAAPDGRVFLTRGFMDQLDAGRVTEAELASVIAHELGHVAHGHTRRRMLDFAGQNVIRSVLGVTLGRFIPGIGPWLGTLVASAIAARLSREDEYQADAFAAALMTKAGFGVGPQVELLARLDRLTGAGGRGPVAWLASHPATDRRIAAIRALEARWHA